MHSAGTARFGRVNHMRTISYVIVLGAHLLIGAAAAGAQQRPQPAPQGSPQHAAAPLQGFSIVLLEGDLQAGKDSDLPLAAQTAITDVREFLPYRSYRVLDAAWTLASNSAGEYST